MVNHFEKQICLGTGISFLFLSLLIMVPNGIVLVALYKNPLHCFRRPFSIFLKFIPAVDFFTGIIVCSGQALTRLLCAFSDGSIPREGDIVRIFAYTAINSSILLVTAMSVNRFTALVFPLLFLRKVKQRSLVAVIISANCKKCGEQKWFLLLIQSSALFLFLNSAANPVLTIFRIRELRKSVKIILHLRQEGNERSLYFE